MADVRGDQGGTAGVASGGLGAGNPVGFPSPGSQVSIEQKRVLIKKQLVILLHSIVCIRRDRINARNNLPPALVSLTNISV